VTDIYDLNKAGGEATEPKSVANGNAIAMLTQIDLDVWLVHTLRGVLVSDNGESVTSYSLAARLYLDEKEVVQFVLHPRYKALIPLIQYDADATPEAVYLEILRVIYGDENRIETAPKPKIILPGQ